jgi:hypothetical protein
MAISVTGPDVGDQVGHLRLLDDQGEWITLGDIPGDMLVIDVFRGHW